MVEDRVYSLMTNNKPDHKVNGGIPIIAVQMLVPIIMAGIIGYGAAKSAAGQQTSEIEQNKREIERLQNMVEQMRTTSITPAQYERMMALIYGASKDMKEIKEDLRDSRR